MSNTFLQQIFSVKNQKSHKVWTIFGIKIKYKRKNYVEPIVKPFLKYLETHVVDHCNLNCKACCHYCNVTPENFIKVEDFERDMKTLSDKFDIGQIRLMGGEPLLHKQVNEFMKITRKYFPNSDIRIVTNGILLAKQDEDFWNTLKETNVRVDMTKYPIGGTTFSEGLDAIGSHLFKYYRDDVNGYCVHKNAMGEFWIAAYFQLTMNSTGPSDINESFKKCPYKRCINLINGKLTHCPTAGYMKNYNNYFHKNLAQEEGIDIYTHSAQEIVEYLKQPVETCKYCVFDGDVKLQKWEVSKKQDDEWFINKN